MRINVRLFAVLRENAGASEVAIDLAEGATVAMAVAEITARFSMIARQIPKAAVAVNMEYAAAERKLSDGDELALIPPVSGGSNDDWLAILSEPIPVDQAIQFVTRPDAGGIALFLGTTRAESGVVALDYEAYEEMAVRQFGELAAEARKKWPVMGIALLHRIGRVEAGRPSVLVAVSTPHRAEAFAACRWLIDSVKSTAAIWKKELDASGSGKWSGHD
ncbi:MAG TPA: MoaD family protein [Tepidisphaeraceae bacterium]|nr:MoaD family protein [Tepidisphaeraceae bacterium]